MSKRKGLVGRSTRRPGQEGMMGQQVAGHQPDCGPEAAPRQAMLVAHSRGDGMSYTRLPTSPLYSVERWFSRGIQMQLQQESPQGVGDSNSL